MAKVSSIVGISNPAQRWAVVVDGSPSSIARILREAIDGDPESYLNLAEAMEERYLHYAGVLQDRKLTLVGEEVQVVARVPNAAAVDVAMEVRRRITDTYQFHDMLVDLQDALAKGYAVVQPHFDEAFQYREYQALDQRYFRFDPETGRKLMVIQEDGSLTPLDLSQVIVHMPRIRTAVPIRTGLARAAAVGYLFHSSTARQWATYVNVYGMPTRIAKFDPESITAAEYSALRTAMYDIGHDAAGLVPLGVELEMIDGRTASGQETVFKEHAQYWDLTISKLVLGQTMTTDSGSSRSQAQVHKDVHQNLLRADARQLAATVEHYVVRPWMMLHYGSADLMPKLVWDIEDSEDIQALSDTITPLMAQGVEFDHSEIRQRIGFSDPQPGSGVLDPSNG